MIPSIFKFQIGSPRLKITTLVLFCCVASLLCTILTSASNLDFAEEAKALRDQRLSDEAKRHADAEAMARQTAEEEERRRILANAKMEAQAPPGMEWNKEAGEYEYIHNPTADSWRD